MKLITPEGRKAMRRVFDKITSARFIISIMVIWTICSVTDKSMDLLVKSLVDKEQFLAVKEVFIYMMGVLSGIAGSVVALYFTRQDRVQQNGDTETDPEKSPTPTQK